MEENTTEPLKDLEQVFSDVQDAMTREKLEIIEKKENKQKVIEEILENSVQTPERISTLRKKLILRCQYPS